MKRKSEIKALLQVFHRDHSPFLLGSVLEHLELTLDKDGRAPQASQRVLKIEELIWQATAQAARAKTEEFFDQKIARHAYWELFGRLQAAGWGRRIPGRRGHPSRLLLRRSGSDGDAGPVALLSCLKELGIQLDHDWDGAALKEAQPVDARALRGGPRRADVVKAIKSRQDDLRSRGVTSLQLFGSVARDEAGPDSDIDLLVSFDAPVTSDSFFGVKFLLEDLLDRRIDLVTDAALREPIRKAIRPELLRVA
jgi:predicted nucleotidyltransferase